MHWVASLVGALVGAGCSSGPKYVPDPVWREWGPVDPRGPEKQVKTPVKRPDARILDDTLAALVADPGVDPFNVRVKVADGQVQLSGRTASEFERTQAEAVARRVPGVRGVVNQIQKRPLEPQAQPSGEPDLRLSSDERIRRAVIDRLVSDSRIVSGGRGLEDGYRVSVRGGTVTLSGSVGLLSSRRAVVEDARAVPGVSGILDRITVRAPRRPNDRLRRDVIAALRSDPYFNPDEIKVSVASGRVALSGRVPSRQDREGLVERISEVPGVIEVRSDVSVAG